ncbi:MAG: aminotransferase class V-fold PLP-dependent enzyme, partial [Burkholderiales bacterium]|nr:aminotransferase class V-fold PLP-dependent enzyme [Burkholderiales bacterium]
MSIVVPQPQLPAGLPDPAALARLASELFGSLPGSAVPVHGVQAPVNAAPAGSALSSPAGFGPGVPGTPIPQGQIPGTNLIPATPSHVLNLGNRALALLPHAQAGNGVPDNAYSAVPGYEPRFGGALGGVPEGHAATAQQAASHPATGAGEGAGASQASPYYFLNGVGGHPAPQAPASVPGASGLDALSRLPFELPSGHRGVPGASAAKPSASVPATGLPAQPPQADSTPAFYFVDAVRLPSGYVTPATPGRNASPAYAGEAHPPFDVHAVRRDFPILQERVNGKQLVWFDNAATTHKPQSVIDRIAYFYEHENSNIHRAAHELAARATDAYEGARERVRQFINAPDVNEVIFVRGTTEAINLVAKSWGWQHIGEGDEIIVSNLEHHANIVPWQQLAAAKGAKIRVIPVDDSGQVLLDEYRKLLNDRTKIVSVTQVSNALGTVVPVKEIVALAHRAGAKALVDGAQSISHMRVDVQDIGADFFVFSGHKVFGPTGIGVVWGKREVLEDMPPWQGGGNMIADVTFEKTVFQPIPNKFEAGT